MAQGGLRLTANPFACLSDDVEMAETAAGGESSYPGGASQPNRCELSFRQFADLFKRVPLPRDNEQKDKFDVGVNFLLGDPIPLYGFKMSLPTKPEHSLDRWSGNYCSLTLSPFAIRY